MSNPKRYIENKCIYYSGIHIGNRKGLNIEVIAFTSRVHGCIVTWSDVIATKWELSKL